LRGGACHNASNGGTWDVPNPRSITWFEACPSKNTFPARFGRTAYDHAVLLTKAAEVIRERAADLARTTVMACGTPLIQATAKRAYG
jgi:hypothetical protein